MRTLLVIASAAIIAASPAVAKNKKQSDPNRLICKSEEMVGSRLQTKKTCLTAMQWDQLQRDQRMTVERVQAFKPNQG